MPTESSKVNDAVKRSANESSLMKRNKRELVGFIFRKDIVETNLTKEVASCQEQLKVQENELAEYRKILNNIMKYVISQHIGSPDCFEIEYQKEGLPVSTLNVVNLQYSKKYGDDYITALSCESHEELTLKISRIQHVDRYWVKIVDENDLAPRSGLYVFVCVGDNHHIHELYRLSNGEPLCKYFSGKYAHMAGFSCINPIAYHFVKLM